MYYLKYSKIISIIINTKFKLYEPSHEKTIVLHMRKQTQISFAVTFVFATWIVQYLYFLNTKFQASSHLQ